jgi:transcriptional regulator with XRE-family HTH domain
MSISQKLREVRDREFGGQQYPMARAWNMHQSTLSRWLRGQRIPDATEYDFLADRLGLSVQEIHELCKAGRAGLTTL